MVGVCGNIDCKMREGNFCKGDYVILNRFGQCEFWWDKNGMRRPISVVEESVSKEGGPHDQ